MVEEKSLLLNKGKMGEMSLNIDFGEIYQIDPKNISVDVSSVYYSNIAFIQVNQRDILVDFLQFPGIKKDGKTVVNGVRVYMPFSAALMLSEVLQNSLKMASDKMEQYPAEKKQVK